MSIHKIKITSRILVGELKIFRISEELFWKDAKYQSSFVKLKKNYSKFFYLLKV